MKLNFYTDNLKQVDIRANSPTREWMDESPGKFAYRCLPLNIANSHGWSIHCTETFSVKWNGEDGLEAITFRATKFLKHVCTSVFGNGILTFVIHGLFQTEPGWNMYVSGPPNSPKDGISPLQGIIETDWAPYSFTMNWQITRKNEWITFEEGEPFCSFFPIKRNELKEFKPEMHPFDANPELKKEHDIWSKRRNKFVKDLRDPESEAVAQKWQKDYFKGLRPDGSVGAEDHQSKLRLKEFKVNHIGVE